MGALELVLYGEEQVSEASIALYLMLLLVCVVLRHTRAGFPWINESVLTLVIGFVFGSILLIVTKGESSRILEFNEDLFFIWLLPPIIFNAGFGMKKKQFFKNFATITWLGAVGTMVSFCIISFGAKLLLEKMDIGHFKLQDYLAIGVIFSATDSVCTLQVLDQDETPLLYSLVFGEGVVNDATSVVLFNTLQKLDLSHINSTMALKFVGTSVNFSQPVLCLVSRLDLLIVQLQMGLLSAYLIKVLITRWSTAVQGILMVLVAGLAYHLAYTSDQSGILAVFFCGIVMSHYTWHNMTESAQNVAKESFAGISLGAETFIFLYIGMDALDLEKWKMAITRPAESVGVSAALFGLLVVGRAAFVFPLSLASKINFKQQVIIWWSGLPRGAVSMALAYSHFAKSSRTRQQENATMITSTISLVLFTIVVFGQLTKYLVRYLSPPSGYTVPSEPSSPTASISSPLILSYREGRPERNLARRPSLQMLLSAPTHTVHYYWRKFDDTIMRPTFLTRQDISGIGNQLV